MRERYHSGMVMMLMNLSINSLCDYFMSVWFDSLLCDSRSDNLLYIGMVSRSGSVSSNSSFGGLHLGLYW